MRKIVSIFCLCLILTGCATTGRLATPSGRPEVFVEGITLKNATDACVNLMVSNGWQIEKTTDYMVQAVRTSDNAMVDFLWGTDFDFHQAWYRITYTFAPQSNGVRIFAIQQVVANRGTGFERVIELKNQKAYQNNQNWLEQLRSNTTYNR